MGGDNVEREEFREGFRETQRRTVGKFDGKMRTLLEYITIQHPGPRFSCTEICSFVPPLFLIGLYISIKYYYIFVNRFNLRIQDIFSH